MKRKKTLHIPYPQTAAANASRLITVLRIKTPPPLCLTQKQTSFIELKNCNILYTSKDFKKTMNAFGTSDAQNLVKFLPKQELCMANDKHTALLTETFSLKTSLRVQSDRYCHKSAARPSVINSAQRLQRSVFQWGWKQQTVWPTLIHIAEFHVWLWEISSRHPAKEIESRMTIAIGITPHSTIHSPITCTNCAYQVTWPFVPGSAITSTSRAIAKKYTQPMA